jgi:hypothetical protein
VYFALLEVSFVSIKHCKGKYAKEDSMVIQDLLNEAENEFGYDDSMSGRERVWIS